MDIHYFIIIYYLAKNKIVIFILEVYECVCYIEICNIYSIGLKI